MIDLLKGTTEILQSLLLRPENFSYIPETYFKYIQFLPLAGIFLIITLLVTPLVGKFAIKYGITDNPPGERKIKLNKYDDPTRHIHKVKTPYFGGLAVMLPILLILPLFISDLSILIPFSLAAVILILIGVLDDWLNLPAQFQLIAQILAATVIAFSIADIGYINNPFIQGKVIDLSWSEYSFNFLTVGWRFVFPGDIFIIPWLILCINAIKWLNGSDGLLEVNMIIAYTIMLILGVRAGNAYIIVLSTILIGSTSGFLIFNYPPAKIFSGSVGKHLNGFIIGTLALIEGAKVATTIIILALPIIDALYVIALRYVKYRPKTIIALLRMNDTNHLHHQLMKMNLSAKKILLIEGSVSLLVGAIAVITTGAFKLFFLFTSILFVLLVIIFSHNTAKKKLEEEKKKSDSASPESKYSY